MGATVDRKALKAALAKLKYTTPRRAHIPSIGNVLLTSSGSDLSLMTTDLEKTGQVLVQAEVEGLHSVAIPFRLLSEVVAAFEGEVLELEDRGESSLTVKCGLATTTFQGISAKDFPPPPDGDWRSVGELRLGGLSSVLHATARWDDSNLALAAVAFESLEGGIKALATDGTRLAVRSIEGTGDWDEHLLVPSSAAVGLCRAFGDKQLVSILVLPHHIRFVGPSYSMTVAKVQGKFPDLYQVIPGPDRARWRVTAKVLSFVSALKVASLVSKESSSIIKLRVRAGGIDIFAGVTGESAINVVVGGDVVPDFSAPAEVGRIAFHVGHLQDVLGACPEDEVTLYGTSGTDSVLFTSGTLTAVLMPMFVQW